MDRIIKRDCNRCDRQKCKGDHKERCNGFVKPKDGFMVAELCLSHPTSLHEALSALPFKTDLSFCLR